MVVSRVNERRGQPIPRQQAHPAKYGGCPLSLPPLTLHAEVEGVGRQDHELEGQKGGVHAVGRGAGAGAAPRDDGRDRVVHVGADEVREAGEGWGQLGDGGHHGVDGPVQELAQQRVRRDAEGVGQEGRVVHPQVAGLEPQAHEDEHDAAEGRCAGWGLPVVRWWVGVGGGRGRGWSAQVRHSVKLVGSFK